MLGRRGREQRPHVRDGFLVGGGKTIKLLHREGLALSAKV
jgi:hypothetical protein